MPWRPLERQRDWSARGAGRSRSPGRPIGSGSSPAALLLSYGRAAPAGCASPDWTGSGCGPDPTRTHLRERRSLFNVILVLQIWDMLNHTSLNVRVTLIVPSANQGLYVVVMKASVFYIGTRVCICIIRIECLYILAESLICLISQKE